MRIKLNNSDYRSKQEFVEDLDLIWQNCRKYDVSPERFGIRASFALKETQDLVRRIPNIVIRDDAEVGAEKIDSGTGVSVITQIPDSKSIDSESGGASAAL